VADDEIMKLYRQGLKDIEIAKILHVKSTFLCEWRKARKLKTNYKQKYKCDRDKLKMVISQGKTLDEMAEIFGVSRSTVYRWEMEMKTEGENEN
jgi:transposase